MSSEKPTFLSQPVVKNIFMFRNGDPYYEARRIVINQKRVSNFETLLREVTGGIQAPFGAVRTIYTPRGGHKVNSMENLKSGQQYVAAGREKFKKLDYLEIGSRRKRMLHPAQVKPPPQNRIIVSARFLKPIKEPCIVFVVANGDVLNPAVRFLIHQRMLGQFDRILEMITEKMGLRVLGGVRSLYTYEGTQVNDGNQLENGQLYVAVGRERFKKMPYIDLLFPNPRGTRRVQGMKAYSLPPLYRFTKQNGNISTVRSKSGVTSSDSANTRDSKASPQASPPRHSSSKKERLSAIVREISQARLISLRKNRSGQTLRISANADLESRPDDGNSQDKGPPDLLWEEEPVEEEVNVEESSEKMVEKQEDAAAEETTEEALSTKNESEAEQQSNGEGEIEKKKKKSAERQDGGVLAAAPRPEQSEEKEEEEQRGEEAKEEATAAYNTVKKEEAPAGNRELKGKQEINGDGEIEKGKAENEEEEEEEPKEKEVNGEAQSNKDEWVGSNAPPYPDKDEQEKQETGEKEDQGSREEEKNSEDPVDGEGQTKKEEDVSPHLKETEESSSNSNQEDVRATKEDESRAEKENGGVVVNGKGEEDEGGKSTDTIRATPDGSSVGDENAGFTVKKDTM